MQNMQNTDTRPLPEGWNQHYESTKQLWYYVQTNGMHPQVSFTHPADMVAANRKVSAYEPNPAMEMPRPASGQTAIQPPSHSSLAPSSQSTFAQRLYASSNNKTAAPVINNNDIKSLSTAPVPDVSQTHSNSMRMSMIAPAPPLPRPQGQIYLPNVPPPSSLSSSQLHRFASLDSYTQKLTGANASRAINSSLSVSMNVEEAASPSFMSASPSQQATAPAPAFAPLPDHGHRRYGRAQTYTEGQSATHSAPFNGPRPTPHLVTVTRPPNELPQVQSWPSINQSSPGYGTEAAPSYAQITPSAGPLSSVSVGGSSMSSVSSNSPPATSILFSPSSVATPSSAPTTIGFPPTSPAMSISSTMSSPTSASFSSAYPSANPRSTNPTPSQGSGRFAAEAAIRLTGSIATAATGIPLRGLARTVGSIVTDQSFINMLKSAFSKSNNGVAESDLQAVIQGQPDANYQAIINALIRQQQLSAQMQLQMGMQYQRPPDANVDYQALIGEIARLQKLNEAAQQQTDARQEALSQLQATAMMGQQQQQSQQQQAVAQQQLLSQQLVQQQQQQQQQAFAQQQALAQQIAQQKQVQAQALQAFQQQQEQMASAIQQASAQKLQVLAQQQANAQAQQLSAIQQQAQQQQQQYQQALAQQQQQQQAYTSNLLMQQQAAMNAQISQPYQPSQQQHQQAAQQQQQSKPPGHHNLHDYVQAFNTITGMLQPQQSQGSTTGSADSGGGAASLFNTITQTLNSTSGSTDPSAFTSNDPSVFSGLVNGFTQGMSGQISDPSTFNVDFNIGDTLNASWSQQ